ncbi:MAG: amino acid decarboxylase [Lachnospiraceae bacterium]|nr:amino acid decarboxylase [Lachnospiraceae bacterium]
MNTPIYDFTENYRESGAIRLHMPGHKGVAGPLGAEPSDITEIDGADVLSQACGIIAESEANAGTMFGCRTLYSTEGSSLCIRAMVFLLKKIALAAEKEPRILAARNVHRSFLDAVAAMDVTVDWIMPLRSDSYERCSLRADELSTIIEEQRNAGEMPTAVYLTSPDYLGNIAEIAAIAEVCHRWGVFLAVDNAHGAYLKFLAQSQHPMDHGADLCCDSAHKTLPVLTGGAYLHISKNTDPFFAEYAGQAMALFATTSPSYLILQSLDLCNAYLAECGNAFECAALRTDRLRDALGSAGYRTAGDERLKITLVAGEAFRDGTILAKHLAERGIVTEYADRDHVVMMFGPMTREEEYDAVLRELTELADRAVSGGEDGENKAPDGDISGHGDLQSGADTAQELRERVPRPTVVLMPSEAILAESEYVDATQCAGRVLAEPLLCCPPCVPVAMCGEALTESVARYVRGRVRVVKEPVRRTHR